MGGFVALFLGVVGLHKVKKKRKFNAKTSASPISITGGESRPQTGRIYAYCDVCGKEIYLPFRCSYCEDYFCDDHILPPKHNCSNIEMWRTKKPLPSGVVWERRSNGKNFYRKE